jgi:hypothetical protein
LKSEKKLSLFLNEVSIDTLTEGISIDTLTESISIDTLTESIELQAFKQINEIDFPYLEALVFDPSMQHYYLIRKWHFDRIEAFYNQNKNKYKFRKPLSMDIFYDVSWLDSFFDYYNEMKVKLLETFSAKGGIESLQNEIYDAIEKQINSCSDNYFINNSLLERNVIHASIQAWDGKLEESDIVRGTGINLEIVRGIIGLLSRNGIIQQTENGRWKCLKRKISSSAVIAMQKRAKK